MTSLIIGFTIAGSSSHDDQKIWTKVEIEAQYKGGPAAWRRYLEKTIRIPPAPDEGSGQYTIIVTFIVDPG